MAMGLPLLVRSATPFAADGSLDEDVLTAYLQRFVDNGIGVLLASGGSGEGFALTPEEVDRVYRVGVAVCAGRVTVGSNQPETHTAGAAIALAQQAVEAGVDIVNLYGPASWHGYVPVDAEYLAYLTTVLDAIRHPVTLSPNATLGYCPSPAVIAELCARNSQIVSVNLSGITGDGYLVALLDRLTRELPIFVSYVGSANTIELGATGLLAGGGLGEGNLLPQSFRRYADLLGGGGETVGEAAELGELYRQLRRFSTYVSGVPGGSPRWIKTALRGFDLPGGEGGTRPPYSMPDSETVAAFVQGARALGLAELDPPARDGR
jgi:dihydrodipicolinate synthase/N-acetylneuraminate lyase